LSLPAFFSPWKFNLNLNLSGLRQAGIARP
jgi:hypothetical protein